LRTLKLMNCCWPRSIPPNSSPGSATRDGWFAAAEIVMGTVTVAPSVEPTLRMKVFSVGNADAEIE
jgi:hypothetical protein